MKQLLLLPILFIAYCSNAQVSKPYYYFPIDAKGQIATDTTKGFTTAKWAIMNMYMITANTGILTVYFDNGSRVNLFTRFKADPTLLRNNFIYHMAALEYMDLHGFRLIDSSGDLLYTFQRK